MKSEFTTFVNTIRKEGAKYNPLQAGLAKVISVEPLIINFETLDFNQNDLMFCESFLKFEARIVSDSVISEIDSGQSIVQIESLDMDVVIEKSLAVGDIILVIPAEGALICVERIYRL